MKKKIKILSALVVALLLAIVVLPQIKFQAAPTEGAVATFTKTDNKNTLQVPPDGVENTYDLAFNLNFPASNFDNFIFTTTEFGHDHACRFNRHLDSYCQDSGSLGGDDIITDGEYIYILNDSDNSLTKFRPESEPGGALGLTQVAKVQGANVANNSMTTDGNFIYTARTIPGTERGITKWNKDLTRARFGDNREVRDWNGNYITANGQYLYSTTTYSGNDILKVDANDPDISKAQKRPLGIMSDQLIKFTSDGNYLYARVNDYVTDEDKICKWDADNLDLKDCKLSGFTYQSMLSVGGDIFAPPLAVGIKDDKTFLFGIFFDQCPGLLNSQCKEVIAYYDRDLNLISKKDTGGGVYGLGITSLGEIELIDSYPVGTKFTQTSLSGGTDNVRDSQYTWPQSNYLGGRVTFTIKVPDDLCKDGNREITNVLWAKVKTSVSPLVMGRDTTTSTCTGSFSQMLRVEVSWPEGSRQESIDLKTLLRDTR